ncbi:MAG: serine hydrolase [Crocinitomicaceae bacterium]|nr:serine hydrolase [Crocinitomicaceae bacterium]
MHIRFWIILLLLFGLTTCKVGRYVVYNFADINDHKKFPYRTLAASESPFTFQALPENKSVTFLTNKAGEKVSFDEHLEKNKTVAFLVIRNDTILYENYFLGYDKEAIVPSFSMAKSFTSILIGCAIEDGLIESINDPVTKYIPSMKKNGFDEVTLLHLLQMTSGIRFNEGYFNPFGKVATFYYGTKLRKATEKLKLQAEPGEGFAYKSGNTQLLGHILDKVLGGKTITDYFYEKIWQPLDMEFEGSWSLDRKKNGIEKTFCCVNARARDFAKIGRLYLNNGNWSGKQLVSEDWVKASTKVDTTAGSAKYYQYQWWLPSEEGDFLANGILGQYIYIYPNKNLIFVRLGKNKGNVQWWSFLRFLAKEVY